MGICTFVAEDDGVEAMGLPLDGTDAVKASSRRAATAQLVEGVGTYRSGRTQKGSVNIAKPSACEWLPVYGCARGPYGMSHCRAEGCRHRRGEGRKEGMRHSVYKRVGKGFRHLHGGYGGGGDGERIDGS